VRAACWPAWTRSAEQLFGESFEAFAARLHARGETPLHDRLGSALLARAVGRRAAAAPMATAPSGMRTEPAKPATPTTGFVAEDAAVAQALRRVERALRSALPVLLQGPTGSGKERLLRQAHAACSSGGRLIVLRCAALDAERLAAELGAALDDPGATLLLDEVGELSAPAQAELLAWIDARSAAGGALRLAATTQHDLGRWVAAGRFRTDLLYRLQGLPVSLPALAQRSDFDACARHALARIAPHAHLEPRALDLLRRHPWPGNWRELQSVLTRAWYDLAPPESATPVLIDAARIEALLGAPRPDEGHQSVLQQETTLRVLREWERQGGSVSATARRLGISRNTVYRHLREAERRGRAATMAP
jgi:sigma-54 dependent transcriptional regulator, acetoin dehydrogenase operon transcriptional activator AcoR